MRGMHKKEENFLGDRQPAQRSPAALSTADHVFEVHAGAVKRRHRQGEIGVAGLDGDRQVGQMLEKLHEVGRTGARREAEVAGLVEDAFHRVGHLGRDVAHLAVLERAGRQVVDVLVVVLGAIEMDRVDEAAGVPDD